MGAAATRREFRLDWGVATRSLPGEQESGDRHIVIPLEGGALVGVVDALGHGPAAADVARRAAATLEAHAAERVDALVRHCHVALRGSRGAVLSLAAISVDDATLTWLGVGNVEGVLIARDAAGGRGRATLLTRRGIVGGELPPLRAANVPWSSGDTLCLATDGIDPGFATADVPRDLAPQAWADRILARYGRPADDALVLVVRFPDPSPSR